MTDWEKFIAAGIRIFGVGGFTITDEQAEQAEMDSSDTMQFSVARMSPVPQGVRPLKSPRKSKPE